MCSTHAEEMAARKSKRLEQAKEGLVDSLTKVVRDAAGELVASAMTQLEKESSSSGSAAARLSRATQDKPDKGRAPYSSSNRKCFITRLFICFGSHLIVSVMLIKPF